MVVVGAEERKDVEGRKRRGLLQVLDDSTFFLHWS